jgi:hypothetical protein
MGERQDKGRGYRVMKLMKNKEQGDNPAVFHFAGKRLFVHVLMKSLHGINVNNGPLFTTDKVCI